MNQITTGCANCYYNLNGYCSYGNSCSGVTCQKYTADGGFITVPLDAPISQIFIPHECSDSPIYGQGSLGIPQVRVNCIVCGKEMIVHDPYQPARVCDECKKAIDWAKGHVVIARKVEEYDSTRLKELLKEKMPIGLSGVKSGIEAEKEDSLEYRQKKDPNGFRITVKEFVQRFVPHGSKVLLVESTIKAQGNNTNTFKIYHNALWEGLDYLITDPIENCPKDLVCNLRDWLVEGVVLPFLGKITLSIRRDNEKTSKEEIPEEVRRWLTQTNSEMNGTKDTIIATNSKEEVWESKPEIIKPNTAIATTEGKIENAC